VLHNSIWVAWSFVWGANPPVATGLSQLHGTRILRRHFTTPKVYNII